MRLKPGDIGRAGQGRLTHIVRKIRGGPDHFGMWTVEWMCGNGSANAMATYSTGEKCEHCWSKCS